MSWEVILGNHVRAPWLFLSRTTFHILKANTLGVPVIEAKKERLKGEDPLDLGGGMGAYGVYTALLFLHKRARNSGGTSGGAKLLGNNSLTGRVLPGLQNPHILEGGWLVRMGETVFSKGKSPENFPLGLKHFKRAFWQIFSPDKPYKTRPSDPKKVLIKKKKECKEILQGKIFPGEAS
ncbi:hypothetical protein GWK47_053635 [Chionoecetes opilio]|uniref:Uncharacterized protein n=1 Tax=Chionoecetes opilio TaxID=41210 RepID=A0A8J5CQJ0_CHIOP|nr:hypothetical protein GWK47_053635 [Chionoecetes opilio]